MKEYRIGNIRVQLLSNEIVRVECAVKGKFCDGNTLIVPDRSKFTEEVESHSFGNVIFFGGYALHIPEFSRTLNGVKVMEEGDTLYSYKRISGGGELPALNKTPEVFALSDSPRIILPEGGYTYRGKKKNSGYKFVENAEDIYLLFCRRDAKKLRKLYISLTGNCELVRLSTLGVWNSKWYAYSEKTAKELISDYEKHNFPLDNMVIDTDWRKAAGGVGYDVNTELFPNLKRFFAFAHSRGVEIMFNDHPEPAEGAENVFSPAEVKLRESKLQGLLKLGLDIWWYDRNWHVKLKSPVKGINPETLGAYIYYEITRNFYEKQAGGQICRRPVIMCNADNIENGVYRGINSGASHRYSIQWTGDIESGADSIAREVENLIRASDNCIPYINSDCGGHTGNPDKETFIRWMQFGALSPVFRPHCTKNVLRYREPWVYDGETLGIVREYANLRYRLLPVIYKNAYNNYLSGEPVFKSLGWEYPDDKRAHACKDEYMLGNDILISPVHEDNVEHLTEEEYLSPVKAVFYNGRYCAGEPLLSTEYSALNLNLNGEPPHEGVPAYEYSAKFTTSVKLARDGELIIKCDDGATVWLDGEKVLEDKTEHAATCFTLGNLKAGEEHSLDIEYFQGGGAAVCVLCRREIKDTQTAVYLPAGRWLDVFGGKIYAGGKYVTLARKLSEMPLFVRAGALIPLAYEAKNTKEQKWDRLVYDFYPDKESADEGYLYEDDGETTAYKYGGFRICPYSAKYEEGKNCFTLFLGAAKGDFDGERAFKEREITLKFHLLKGAGKVNKVTLNGADVNFGVIKKDEGAFPLSAGASPTEDALEVKFTVRLADNYEIKFYVG